MKKYVSEVQLKEIFDTLFTFGTWEDFYEWSERKMGEGEIESVEFNYYEISNLIDKPMIKLADAEGDSFTLMRMIYKALKKIGKEEKAIEMCDRIITQADNSSETMLIIKEYVEVV